MKETILALLIAKFSGVRKDGLVALARSLALQCTTEDEAKTLVDKFTDAQVNEFVKDYRADVDKEVSESNKTFETNLKKKFDLVQKTEPGGKKNPKDTDTDDIAAIVKAAVDAAVAPLNDKLNGYEAKTIAETRLQALNEKLNGCKDENFKAQTLKDFARMNFKDDADFNEYLTGKEADIATANQNKADADLSNSGGSPLFAQKEESGISKGVAEYVESLKPENTTFKGKEI
ncbi:MAG: protein of unknown function DUF4355 [Bacteriophage sp.]|nr:MAG: protein of unknown function DUF4355 [Bacteriophage sp.]